MPAPKFPTDEHRYHFTCCGWNGLHYLGFVYQLKRDERKMHQAAVYYALENAPDFEIIEWYSKKRKAAGKVRVIDSNFSRYDENYKLIGLFSSIDFFIANTIFSTSYAFIKSTSG